MKPKVLVLMAGIVDDVDMCLVTDIFARLKIQSGRLSLRERKI